MSGKAARPTLRHRVFDVVEGGGERTLLSDLFAAGLVAVILVNVVASILETVPELAAAHRPLFRVIERVSLVIFSVEYLVRLWICVEEPRYRGRPAWRARLAYLVTPAAIIDLIAVLPFFLGLAFDLNVRTLVVLRLLRLFKLGRYSTGFQSLYEAVRREREALLASFLVLFAVVLVAASLVYVAERSGQPELFGSIPAAMWWAVETVTTVGYGDATPKTLFGRIVGGMTMITGILMIALPVAIIGSSFAEVVRQRSFVVTFGLVARIPTFAGFPPDILAEMLGVIHAVTVESGVRILGYGDADDSLFVIATGIVEIDTRTSRRRLGTGAVFGAGVEDAAPDLRPDAIALTRVKLLAIRRTDLLDLVARYPDVGSRLGLSPGAEAPAAPAAKA